MITSIGFGTYGLKKDTYESVLTALNAGYRHIDTATLYRNEKAVGKAIHDSGVERKDIFLTTKIPKWKCKSDEIEDSILESINSLGVEYIDLILIHNPVENKVLNNWLDLECMYNKMDGKIKHIGVSNFRIDHLETVLEGGNIKPFCNQIEITPFLQRNELVQFCRNNDILVVAHSSLTKGERLTDKTLIGVADRNYKSPAQILLKWGIQKNYIVLPRSNDESYIKENINLDFTIERDDMIVLDTLEDGFCTHPNVL